MKTKKKLLDDAMLLRRNAEKRLKENPGKNSKSLTEADTIKLMYELEVHQIELEMQNEELQAAKLKSEINAEKYINLYDFAPAGYFTLDKLCDICELNLSGAKMLGKDRSKLINNNLKLFITPDTRILFNDFFSRVFITQTKQSCEIQLCIEETPTLFVHLDGIVSDNGQQCLLTVFDLSERLKAEKAVKQSEERFQLLFNKAPMGYQSLDNDGRFIAVNQQWLDTLGYEKEEVIGKWFGDFLTSFYQDSLRKQFPGFKKSGEIHSNFEMIHKNGSRIFVAIEGKIGYDISGTFKQTHCIIQDITERKQWEEKLKESEERMRLAIVNSPVPIMIYDDSDQVIQLSNGWTKFSGYTIEDIPTIGDWTEKAYGSKKAINKDSIDKLFLINKPKDDGEWKIKAKDGSSRIWAFQTSPLGEVQHGRRVILNVAIDITERKLAEEKLITAKNKAVRDEEYYQNILNHIGDPVFVKDEQSNLIFVNDAFCEILDLTRNKILGKTLAEDVAPDEQEQFLKIDRQVIIDGKENQTEESLTVRGGKPKTISTKKSRFIDDYGEKFLIGIIHDISERKKTEDILRSTEMQYRELFEEAPFGFHEINTEGRIMRVNHTELKMLGYKEEEMLNHMVTDFLFDSKPGDERIRLKVEGVVPTGKEFEVLYRKKDGSIIPVAINDNLITDSNGKVTGLRSSMQDITGRKQAELELIEAKERAEESDRLKSAFLANMSHEIRTPMNGILGFSELLKQPNLTGADQQRYIGIIEKSGVRMLNIINDIVDISKIEAGLMTFDLVETNVNEQIEYIYTFFKPEVTRKGIQLSFLTPLPKEEAILKTDREKLYAIFTNLVKNAIKFSTKGKIEVGYVIKTGFLEFYVKDTGIGIPRNRQEAIFERFIQSDIADGKTYQGAGLGLSISKAYVEMLGGTIWVESEKEKGSTFYFTLPYQAVAIKVNSYIIENSASDPVITTDNLKILIVEDDEISEELISIAVRKFKKEIIRAKTGTEAVAACNKYPDIDIIFMDIQMPEMNGYEATRQIRKFNKNVIIIAQTAFALQGDKEKAIAAGCTDFISKPIRTIKLQQMIIKYFSK